MELLNTPSTYDLFKGIINLNTNNGAIRIIYPDVRYSGSSNYGKDLEEYKIQAGIK